MHATLSGFAVAPVCDFKSWPGAFGKGKRSEVDWQRILQLYGFKNDDEAKAYPKNPVDNLASLAAAKVPLLHVYGDADEVVPWDENTGLIAELHGVLKIFARLHSSSAVFLACFAEKRKPSRVAGSPWDCWEMFSVALTSRSSSRCSPRRCRRSGASPRPRRALPRRIPPRRP